MLQRLFCDAELLLLFISTVSDDDCIKLFSDCGIVLFSDDDDDVPMIVDDNSWLMINDDDNDKLLLFVWFGIRVCL